MGLRKNWEVDKGAPRNPRLEQTTSPISSLNEAGSTPSLAASSIRSPAT
jgi:hypothetical protein